MSEALNELQLNENFLNEPPAPPCSGVTLQELRNRLRAMLSSYAIGTLIPNEPGNDLEAQYINDGISQLWPHDYRVDSYSQLLTEGTTRFSLPLECEHVLGVYTGIVDDSNQTFQPVALPHYDAWVYDNSFMEALPISVPGQSLVWTGQMTKTIQLTDPYALGSGRNYTKPSYNYLIVRYAMRWPALIADTDCINPAANRIQAIIFYAAHAYMNSQYEVNTESIRYQNYMGIATRFYQLFQQTLVRDSKPLYIS